jgi:RNA polymerase sigma-70 factor (ECF subfamily)
MDRQQIIEQLPALRRYARALTGDAWAADDLVQDTLERACTRWALWQSGTDLRAWLFTVMHNLYLNQRRRHEPCTPLDDVDQELPATAQSPTDDEIDLSRCLQRLSPDQRAVVLMVGMQEMSYTSTAQVLGVPVGTVMSRLSRARERLRELMHGGGPLRFAPAPAQRQPPLPPHSQVTQPPSQPPSPPAGASVLRRLK